MTPSTPKPKRGSVDIEALLSWLEQQPELEHLRSRAGGIKCEYKRLESTPEQRIRPSNLDINIQSNKKGIFGKIFDQVWVPGSALRGNAYTTPQLDKSLNAVAKLMCISTLWDFFTTIPIFQYSLSGPLAVASGPAAVVFSFILMVASNVVGEKSTDRSKGNKGMANISLAAFVILCTAKTMVSGVGVDLWIGSKAIATNYAAELAQKKLKQDQQELLRLQTADPALVKLTKGCADLEQQMKAMDRSTNETAFISLYVRAYGTNVEKLADQGLTNQQLVKKYGAVSRVHGVCRQRDVLQELNQEAAKPLEKKIEVRSSQISQKSSLTYLQTYESEIFQEHFRFVNGELQWVNGTEAVGQATNQFYRSLLAGEFGLLGFSLFTLGVSVILTGAASLMLFLMSRNEEVKASFTADLGSKLNEQLAKYEQAIQQYLKMED